MSFGKLIAQTATMILTGKVVNAGFEKGKQKYAEYKEKKADASDPKQVGSVTQVDTDADADADAK